MVVRPSVIRLTHSDAVSVIGELGCQGPIGDLSQSVGMVVGVGADAVRRQVAVVISGIGHASSESS